MELTKADLKHIEKEVDNLALRIKAEATEYALLYEITFYNRLIQELHCKIDACATYQEIMKKK